MRNLTLLVALLAACSPLGDAPVADPAPSGEGGEATPPDASSSMASMGPPIAARSPTASIATSAEAAFGNSTMKYRSRRFARAIPITPQSTARCR